MNTFEAPLSSPWYFHLSRILVAHIIECDNEFERRLSHRTSADRGKPNPERRPWLTSVAMWWTCLRFLTDDGISIAELQQRSGLSPNLAGMERWSYISIARAAPSTGRRIRRNDSVLIPTAAGRAARDAWPPIFQDIEKRWRRRFGDDVITGLRSALTAIGDRLAPGLPDFLPILGHGLFSRTIGPADSGDGGVESRSLVSLMARPLLAFTLDIEQDADVSLALGANVLINLSHTTADVRLLPESTGVSKEAIAMALNFLKSHNLAVVEPAEVARAGRQARLTDMGLIAQDDFHRHLADVNAAWTGQIGTARVRTLNTAARRLSADGDPTRPPLRECLEPHLENWRAQRTPPRVLPAFPMILHRGGYPDGS